MRMLLTNLTKFNKIRIVLEPLTIIYCRKFNLCSSYIVVVHK